MFQCAWFFHCFVIIYQPSIEEGVKKGDNDGIYCHIKEKSFQKCLSQHGLGTILVTYIVKKLKYAPVRIKTTIGIVLIRMS